MKLKHSNQASTEVKCEDKNIVVIEKPELAASDLVCVQRPECSENSKESCDPNNQCKAPSTEVLDETKMKVIGEKKDTAIGDTILYRCIGDNTYFDEESKEQKSEFTQTCSESGLTPKLPKCQLYCPEDYIKGPNGQCYYISDIEYSQSDAARHCNEVGGNLLEIANEQDKLEAVVLMEIAAEKTQKDIEDAQTAVGHIKDDSGKLLDVLKEKRRKMADIVLQNRDSVCQEKNGNKNEYLIHPISMADFCNEVADILVRNLENEIAELSEIPSSSIYLSDFREKIEKFVRLDMNEIDAAHKTFIDNAKLVEAEGQDLENINKIMKNLFDFLRMKKREKLGNYFRTSFFSDELFSNYLNEIFDGETKAGRHKIEKAILDISAALIDDETDFEALLNEADNEYCERLLCVTNNVDGICTNNGANNYGTTVCEQIKNTLLDSENVVTNHFIMLSKNDLDYVKKLNVESIAFGIKRDIGTQEESELEQAELKLRTTLNRMIPKLDYGESQFDPDRTRRSIISDLLDKKGKNFLFTVLISYFYILQYAAVVGKSLAINVTNCSPKRRTGYPLESSVQVSKEALLQHRKICITCY